MPKKKKDEDIGYVFIVGGESEGKTSRGASPRRRTEKDEELDRLKAERLVDLTIKAILLIISIIFFTIAAYALTNGASGVAGLMGVTGLTALVYIPFLDKGWKGVIISFTIAVILYLLFIAAIT